jgi:hypothetical protein
MLARAVGVTDDQILIYRSRRSGRDLIALHRDSAHMRVAGSGP